MSGDPCITVNNRRQKTGKTNVYKFSNMNWNKMFDILQETPDI